MSLLAAVVATGYVAGPCTDTLMTSDCCVTLGEEHYFAIVGERCTGCSSVVLEQDLVRVQNKPWHAKCLVCAHCGIALAKAVDKNAPAANGRDLDAGSIFHKDNSVYCKADYLDLFCKRLQRLRRPHPQALHLRQRGALPPRLPHLRHLPEEAQQVHLHTGAPPVQRAHRDAVQQVRVLCLPQDD